MSPDIFPLAGGVILLAVGLWRLAAAVVGEIRNPDHGPVDVIHMQASASSPPRERTSR